MLQRRVLTAAMRIAAYRLNDILPPISAFGKKIINDYFNRNKSNINSNRSDFFVLTDKMRAYL